MSFAIRSAARSLTSRLALGCLALAVLSACNRGGDQRGIVPSEPAELTWARAALERNPRFEVLASDTQTRVFTVRDRSTGQVQTFNLNDLVAAPVAQLKASSSTIVSEPTPAPLPSSASIEAPTPHEPEQPAQVADNSPGTAVQTPESNYTIDRTGGQLRVTGPGVSIVSSSRDSTPDTSNLAGARAAEPIICEGKRLLKLDDRNIYVDGDAIIARGGCELYITNSRVIASGTGLIVDDAIVHVANSHIEGVNGSFNATDRAKMFVRTSTFQGMPRRTEFASVLDQGGNQWR